MKKLFLLIFSLTFLLTKAQIVVSPITTLGNGTFVVPAGVTSIKVECWGGGGGGGGATSSIGSAAGGGGGGAYAMKIVSVIPGETLSYTVGAGGIGSAGAVGTNGSDTYFNNTATVVLAKGGNGGGVGPGGAGGQAAACLGTTIFSGGNGASSILGISGGGGGAAGSSGVGGNGANPTGGLGSASGGGNGGNGHNSAISSGAGGTGLISGGGGGGGLNMSGFAANGGNGAAGKIVMTYTVIPIAISNITPSSGSVGTTVTLTGSGYAASGNIVYVGGIKATIISESTTSISFKVPCGSEYEYVVVINPTSGLSAKSNQKFKTLFPFPTLSASNFKSPVDIVATSGSTGFQSELADLNNDGYLDLITAQGSTSISIYKNQGTANITSSTYTTEQKYNTGSKANFVETADFDGDGKLDVLVSCENSTAISLYKNTSTVSAIALTSKGNITIPGSPTSIAFADFNKDGKLDILVGVYTSQAIVYTNTSTSSNLSFTGPTTIISSVGGLHDVDAADIDGDGWEDFIVGNNNSPTYVLRNIANGTIGVSGAPISIAYPSYNLDLGDYNGDGTIDVALAISGGATKIVPNNSILGTISFGTPIILSNTGSFGLNMNDFDGDGNIDIGVFNSSTNIVAMRNTGGSYGSPLLASTLSGALLFNITSGDLNCDNTPDLVVTNNSNATVRIIPVEQPPCTQPLLVTSTADDSICGTLRYAIGYANYKAGADVIDFNISGAAPFIISLLKPLPDIKDALIIDGRVSAMGYTDPTSATKADYNLVMEIDGSVNNFSGINGLNIKASDVTIRGLSIVGFADAAAIYAENANNVAIEGNYLGLRANGDKQPNGNGVIFRQVGNASPKFSYIGGGSTKDRNVICANNGDGIQILNSPGVSIIRNFVGVWKDGAQSVPNNGYGVYVESSDNVNIGINQSGGFGNVIASNKGGQIMVTSASSGVTIVDNYIGLASDGTTALASPSNGITINDSKNTIVGSVAFPNKIANNGNSGVFFSGSSSQYNSIISNSIYNNTSEGIELEGFGEQEVIQPPVISTGVLNGDGSATFTLQAPNATPSIDSISFYADNGTEGQVFLTKVKKTASNVYTLTAAIMSKASVLSGTVYYTSLQTSMGLSSSAFSNAISLVPYAPPTQPLGNRGIYFENANAYISAPIATTVTDNFTMEAWVKLQKYSNLEGFIVYNGDPWIDGYGLYVNKTGAIVYKVASKGDGISGYNLELNKWTHVALVRESGVAKIYVNGILQTLTNSTYAPFAPTGIFQIGGFSTPSRSFLGQIDEVRMFSIARTSAEIQSDMGSTSVNSAIGYWNFEQSTTNIANDVSGFGRNGTLTNGPLWALRVTDTGDNALIPGTFRWTITEANTDIDKDYIDFSIQQTDAAIVSTLATTNELTVTKSIFIDGYSAYGSSPNTASFLSSNNAKLRVECDFSGIPGNLPNGSPLYSGVNLLGTSNSIVRGLSMYSIKSSWGSQYHVNFTNTSNSSLQGCYIGLKADGSVPLNIGMNGIGIGTGSTLDSIGGQKSETWNIISNTIFDGIQTGGSGNFIYNNYIGTDKTGNVAIPNNSRGISLNANGNSVIHNLISGNGLHGIIVQVGASGSIIKGNYIGIKADKSGALANVGDGIRIETGSINSIIGGTIAADSNTIAYNASNGISVDGTTTLNNKISRNAIYSNTLSGISLTNGGNNLKAVPIISSATDVAILGTCVAGDVVEIFNDSPQSGTNNQGRKFLGVATTTGTDWSFSGSFTVGDRITATATDVTNGTSEFSAAKLVVACTPFVVTSTADAGVGTLRQAILDANASNCTGIIINVTTSGTITLASPLPAVTSPLTINGNGVTVSGNNQYSVFVINDVKVTINDLNIIDGYAKGGDGASSTITGAGGGGGAGLGGGISIVGVNSDVTLNGVSFLNNKAVGGNGGGLSGWSFTTGGKGGDGGMGSIPVLSGSPGSGGLSYNAETNGTDGGLFSGGGGAGNPVSASLYGGNGGLFAGGGGGGVRLDGNASNCPPANGNGGLFGGDGGKSCGGSYQNGGGGGAGLGGAVFLYQGKLTINNSNFSNNNAIGGTPAQNGSKGQGKGGAIFVYNGATILATGTNTFVADSASDDRCLPLDNNAYYNGNSGAINLINLPEIDVLNKTFSIVNQDYTPSITDSTDFGFASSVTYTIKNTGTEVLSISSITLSTNTNFSISGAPINVPIGASASFKVNFNYVSGGFTDTVKILSNDCDEGVYKFVIKGNLKGAALDFDGVDDKVTIPHNVSLNAFPLTAECWFKAKSTNTCYEGIINKYYSTTFNGWSIFRNQNDIYLYYYVNSGSFIAFSSTGVNVADGIWHHVAIVVDNTGGKIFIDGALRGSGTWTGTPSACTTTQPVTLGQYPGNAQTSCTAGTVGYFTGNIDEVRIWSRTLCEAEILNNMNCEQPANQVGLEARYDLNQGIAGGNNSVLSADKIAVDSSGKNNDGTLSGFDLISTTSNWIAPGKITSGAACAPVVLLPAGTTWTWTGAVSRDWFSPCNWDMLSVPDATSLVEIPKVTNQPKIIGTKARCKALKIYTTNGAMLELDRTSGGSLDITHP